MNITYKINKLEVIPSQNQFINIVKTVHYSIIIKDGNYSAEIIDYLKLSEPEPFQFIAYDNLTEAIVIGWVKSNIDVSEIENTLRQKLESIKNPTELKDPPWSS
jgi:hypothetical protein